jgi:DNA-binding transcriptional regulator YhcF (GntR family)
MEIKIDPRSGIPLYEQIAFRILRLIENGELKPGDQLPTTRKLAVELGINFNTVARAYRMLDQKGAISTQQGRGTYVLSREKKTLSKRDQTENIKKLTRFYIRKAKHLGFEAEEIRAHFERIYQEGTER